MSTLPVLRPFGWAGFLLDVPDNFRIYKVEGAAVRGMIGLADRDRPRLEILWATARPGIDPETMTMKHLRRLAEKGGLAPQSPDWDKAVRRVENAAFSPLLCRENAANRVLYCVGYAPATRRAFEIAYRLAGGPEDDLFTGRVLPNMVDQPPAEPHKWAFLGVSFISPPGFLYHSCTLNLGDMAVRLIRPSKRGKQPEITIRQIYPAELALSRRPLEQWLEDIEKQGRHTYLGRYRKWFRRGGLVYEDVTTSVGKGLAADLRLRLVLLPFWRLPRAQRLWLIHDKNADRLVNISISGDPAGFDETLNALLSGLHWAQPRDVNR